MKTIYIDFYLCGELIHSIRKDEHSIGAIEMMRDELADENNCEVGVIMIFERIENEEKNAEIAVASLLADIGISL